jgi:hypothetical protein
LLYIYLFSFYRFFGIIIIAIKIPVLISAPVKNDN